MIDVIKGYKKKHFISFHTPAHMGRNKYINKILKSDYDLTELSETDNLFYESGCIKKLEERLAKRFKAKAFYLLVNGATSGVMAAINLFKENDKILIDRNCHISVINALILSGAKPVFIKTDYNEFNIPLPPKVEEIKKAYEQNKDAKAIFLTSPNYYGMRADLKEISEFLKDKELISIVDEAHGTHSYYDSEFLNSSELGFDICVLSFHKNLPSLTQTGGIIVNNTFLKEKIKENLRAFTSTSPSYLFMLSIDAMDRYMVKKGVKKLKNKYEYLKSIKASLKEEGINVLMDNDPLKIVVNCKNADKRAEDIKKKYKLVCEMCDSENITYIVSIHNKIKEIKLLKKALLSFCREKNSNDNVFSLPKLIVTPKEACNFPFELVELKDSQGRIAAEYVITFPPSVPVIVPGEEITKDVIKLIKNKKEIKCVKYVF